MVIRNPRAPPRDQDANSPAHEADAPIKDMRNQFSPKTPPSAEDQAQARAFIDAKIDMIRGEPHLSEAEKRLQLPN